MFQHQLHAADAVEFVDRQPVGGMLLLGEQPGWSEFLGAGLILGALATVLLPQRK